MSRVYWKTGTLVLHCNVGNGRQYFNTYHGYCFPWATLSAEEHFPNFHFSSSSHLVGVYPHWRKIERGGEGRGVFIQHFLSPYKTLISFLSHSFPPFMSHTFPTISFTLLIFSMSYLLFHPNIFTSLTLKTTVPL